MVGNISYLKYSHRLNIDDGEMDISNREIDIHNRIILDYINKLYNVTMERGELNAVENILDKLYEYCLKYFAEEEKRIENKPERIRVLKLIEQSKFANIVRNLKKDLKESKAGTEERVLNFLISWFIGNNTPSNC